MLRGVMEEFRISLIIVILISLITAGYLVSGHQAGRSPVTVTFWAKAEINFYNKLKSLDYDTVSITDEEKRDLVNRYIHEFEEANLNLRGFKNRTLEEKAWAINSNPLAIFRMFRRIHKELTSLNEILLQPDPYEFLPTREWISRAELRDVMTGILRLFYFYNFNLKKLAQGEFYGIQTGIRLSSLHFYEIGKSVKISRQYFAQGIQFLDFAYAKASVDGAIDPKIIKSELFDLMILHDNEEGHLKNQLQFFQEPLIPLVKSLGPFYPFMYETEVEFILRTRGWPFKSNVDVANFVAVCRESSLLAESEKTKLFCWYERNLNPYFAINPLKLEILSRSPSVFQIYDVISDRKIQLLKNIASQNLTDSKVSLSKDFRGTFELRTSVSCWSTKEDHKDLIPLYKSFQAMTGMKVLISENYTGEELFIVAYTFLGYYDVHMDAQYSLDRIATFMYYLEDAELGGHTALPNLLIAAKPVKGSAVLWFNMFPSGEPDRFLVHGACPVILGNKWIGNKWPRYHHQTLAKKCPTTHGSDRYGLVSEDYIDAVRRKPRAKKKI